MSGGPGGVPECVNANYVGDFFEPATSKGEFSTTYHPNDTVTLSWFGGKIPESLSVSQIFSLFLQNSSTSAVLQSTHITILGMRISLLDIMDGDSKVFSKDLYLLL